MFNRLQFQLFPNTYTLILHKILLNLGYMKLTKMTVCLVYNKITAGTYFMATSDILFDNKLPH